MTTLPYIRKHRLEGLLGSYRSERFKMFRSLIRFDDLMPRMDALRSDECIAFSYHHNNAQSYIETLVDTVSGPEYPFHRAFQTLLNPAMGIKRFGVNFSAHNQRRSTANRFGADGIDRIRRRQTDAVTGHVVAAHVKTLCWHFDTKPRHEVRFAMENAAKAADVSKATPKTTVKLQVCNAWGYKCHHLELATTLSRTEQERHHVSG